MESGALPVVRIADDGELADVRQLLEQLGVEWVAADETPERATALLIASPRRLVGARSSQTAPPAPFRIVVADKMTKSLQREIERNRPDFLVSRPFHAAALRLLILHALYVGPERRTSARAALSAAIRFRTSVFSRTATLVELSRGGCRLIAERVPAAGETVTVILPRELTGNGQLSLAGRVVGADPAGGFDPGEQACSVAFEALDNDKRRALRNIMAKQAVGCATLAPRPGTSSDAPPAKVAAAERAQSKAPAAQARRARAKADADAQSGERRQSPRRAYSRPVLASSGGAARILIGRDLSSGGMRVARDADLIVGEEFKLVVYGPAGRPPLLVRSVVSRDDGPDGFVLVFQEPAAEIVAELCEWMNRLPQLAPAPAASQATHSVVSQVVEEPEDAKSSDPA